MERKIRDPMSAPIAYILQRSRIQLLSITIVDIVNIEDYYHETTKRIMESIR